MATGQQKIESDDGTFIFVQQFHIRNPKAQCLVSHGYLEHCGRYEEFAKYLNSKGINVHLYDLRGHGNSDGKPAYLDDWKNYLADLNAVRSTLLPPEQLPTFLIGHSTGALIAIDSLLQQASVFDYSLHELSGVILTGPYIQPAEKLNPLKVHVAKVFGSALPSLKVPAGMSEAQHTNDPQKQIELRNDEKVMKNATAGWASECLLAQERVQSLVETTALPIPVLYVYGGADTIACPEVNARFAETLMAKRKTVVKRKEEQHEVLNEENRKELFNLISNWMLRDYQGILSQSRYPNV